MQRDKVLIVEDEGLIANDIATQLRASGYDVPAVADSGEDALSILEHSQPDLVLMDIRLKGKMDGIDAAQQIRAKYALPVIFLTSHTDNETLRRAKYAEPFGYLVKPFRKLTLCSAIEIAIFKSRCERALVEREAWLTTVLQSTGDPTIVTNLGGLVEFLNPSAEQLLGCQLSEVAGLPWVEVAPLVEVNSGQPLSWPDAATSHPKKLPSGSVLRRRHGADIAVEGEISPSVFHGELAGAVISMRDISQRTAAEAEARHEHKMMALGRMAGAVSHDFNNLLTVILGHGSLLENTLSRPDQLLHCSAIVAAAETATGITKQLLALSGKAVLVAENLDVNARIIRLVRMLEPTLGTMIHVETKLDGVTGKVRINSAQFDQVLMNLLLNARDAMPAGGIITVSTANRDRVVVRAEREVLEGLVSITVADTGKGIPPEVREHLFEPFFTTKPHDKGTGLGLSIVYGIVKDAGGEVAVHSTPGFGATFDVLMPRVEENLELILGVTQAAHSTHSGQMTILLAEDEPSIRELVQCYLERCGYRVLVARNGCEALDMAEQYADKIDLLLSDVLMPEMGGPALAKLLNVARPSMKVLLMSAYTGASIEVLRSNSLRASFLQKPFSLPELLDKVIELTTPAPLISFIPTSGQELLNRPGLNP